MCEARGGRDIHPKAIKWSVNAGKRYDEEKKGVNSI